MPERTIRASSLKGDAAAEAISHLATLPYTPLQISPASAVIPLLDEWSASPKPSARWLAILISQRRLLFDLPVFGKAFSSPSFELSNRSQSKNISNGIPLACRLRRVHSTGPHLSGHTMASPHSTVAQDPRFCLLPDDWIDSFNGEKFRDRTFFAMMAAVLMYWRAQQSSLKKTSLPTLSKSFEVKCSSSVRIEERLSALLYSKSSSMYSQIAIRYPLCLLLSQVPRISL